MPGRNLSTTERRLLDRWNAGVGPSLRSIEITGSGLRGLQNFTMDFRYPLAVIAGKNGVGKFTILACAACAYQNRTTFKSLLNEEQYYNFHDFLITGWGDTAPQDVIVTWTHRLQDNSISIVPAHKEQGRWRGYRRRPSRPTDFIGTIRAVHPCEFKVLRSRFETTAAIPHQDLSNDQRACVGVIVGRTYTSVKVGNSGRHRLHRLHCGPSEYSAFNAGSGEDISCLLIRALTNLPDGGLLIVEEIETGLHASAQRRLAEQLIDHCSRRRIQVICSTHSADFLAAIPQQARILLCRPPTGPVDVRYEVTVAEATSDMIETPIHELVVCVEDRFARTLAMELFPSALRTRLRVVPCGSWEDVLRQLASFCRDPQLGHVIGVLDGDRRNGAVEHEGRFRQHLGGQISDAQRQWLNDRICYFPEQVPPERWLWQVGQQSAPYRVVLAEQLRADNQIIDSIFAGQPPANLHGLPYAISQRVGSDEERALTAMCTAAVLTQMPLLQEVVTFVQQRLDAN